MTYKLLGVGTNAKTVKGDGSEYLTAILYMTPWKVMVEGKQYNSCPMAEQAKCIDACLYTAGRGAFNNVQAARMRVKLNGSIVIVRVSWSSLSKIYASLLPIVTSVVFNHVLG
tara:strand:+ start:463 stop:801 length:339 start_codon:yes stop_codon:yes gene_type:complete